MQYHLEALGRCGYAEVVINTAWLGELIEQRFSTAPSSGAAREWPRIHYSHEGRDFGGALETAGGIARALPLLDEVFWLVGGDVYVPEVEFRARRVGTLCGRRKAGPHLPGAQSSA